MAPRKSVWVLRIVSLVVLLTLLIAPSVIARNSSQLAHGGHVGGGGDQISNPPGGPTGGGGGDNGDPDDISILFNGPTDPGVISNGHNRTGMSPVRVRIEPYRAGAWYVFFWWTGIGW